jgi:hypothetical protein
MVYHESRRKVEQVEVLPPRDCQRSSAVGVLRRIMRQPAAVAAVRWESRDGPIPPSLSESSDCRTQAVRQAEQRYPRSASGLPLRAGVRMATGLPDNADRFPAENAFYADCMHQKGFRQAPAGVR